MPSADGRRGMLSSPTYPPLPRFFWSPPEQNASSSWRPPWFTPVSRMTPTDASSRASEKASYISITVSGVNALRRSGRLMEIFATPSHNS